LLSRAPTLKLTLAQGAVIPQGGKGWFTIAFSYRLPGKLIHYRDSGRSRATVGKENFAVGKKEFLYATIKFRLVVIPVVGNIYSVRYKFSKS
jgi:hypothetical protein